MAASYPTAAGLNATTVPAGVTAIQTDGYYDIGDGGDGLYRRRLAPEPSGPGDITSNGGTVRWALEEISPNVLQCGARGDGVSDDYAAITAADAYARSTGKILFFPATGAAYRTTKYLVQTASWAGVGAEDIWDGVAKGAVIMPMGPGFPERWTDIDGSDPADDLPCIVVGRSEISITGITVECPTSQPWSHGIFVPCTRRNRLIGVNTTGPWSVAGVYLSASWSNTNTTLTSLHPEVRSSEGLNEMYIESCFLMGLWGLMLEGTTRDPANYPNSWVWAPGGVSDLTVVGTRMGTSGDIGLEIRKVDGGCYYSNARVPNTIGATQGHNFYGCSFRSAARYTIKTDYSAGDTFTTCYAETINSFRSQSGGLESVVSLTSNTAQMAFIGHRGNNDIFYNGVPLSDMLDYRAWTTGGRLSVNGIGGNVAGVWGTLPLANRTIEFMCRQGNAINLGKYDPTTYAVTVTARLAETSWRPETPGGVALGTTTYPFGIINATDVRVTTVLRATADNVVDCGAAGQRWAQVRAATGTINTSDARQKTAPLPISDAVLDAWGDVQHVTFKWLDAVTKKGDAARTHFGIIAQQVRDAFIARDLDGRDYGLLCYDEWEAEYEPVMATRTIEDPDEEGHMIEEEYDTGEVRLLREAGNAWGIRADQCLFLEAAWQRRRADRIESRLAAIEAHLGLS